MMGDPFGGMEIEKGVLKITHEGGSSWKWWHTDKYRFDGKEFRLIGYVSNAGKICEYWKDVDFNLVTGTVVVKKEYERCEKDSQEIYRRENETFIKKGISITLQNRRSQEIKITSPRYKHDIYVALKMED